MTYSSMCLDSQQKKQSSRECKHLHDCQQKNWATSPSRQEGGPRGPVLGGCEEMKYSLSMFFIFSETHLFPPFLFPIFSSPLPPLPPQVEVSYYSEYQRESLLTIMWTEVFLTCAPGWMPGNPRLRRAGVCLLLAAASALGCGRGSITCVNGRLDSSVII